MLALIGGFFLILSVSMYSAIFTKYVRARFGQEIALVADSLTSRFSQLLLPGKGNGLPNAAFSLSGQGLLCSVVVHSSSGQALFSNAVASIQGTEVALQREVYSNGWLLGSVEFRFSNASHESQIRFSRLFMAGSAVLLLLIVVVTVHFLLLHQVRRPLHLMMWATESIARGDFSIRLHLPVRDELALLGADITAMSHRLKRSFREIEEKNEAIRFYSEDLEKMVHDRTLELDRINKELESRNRQFIKELKMAQSVQLGMIPEPSSIIAHKHLAVSVHYEAMSGVGGDLVDIVRVGRNSYAFLIADVCGHGVPSALITAMAKVSFMASCRWGLKPDELCTRVNKEISRLISGQWYFISMYLGIMDMENGIFSYTNCGHHPALLQRGDGVLVTLNTDGKLAGVWEDAVFETQSVVLNPGDSILMFTDGITEARNPEGDFYGVERLHEYCRGNIASDAEPFLSFLIEEVNAFCEGRDADDDRALLYIRFGGVEIHEAY